MCTLDSEKMDSRTIIRNLILNMEDPFEANEVLEVVSKCGEYDEELIVDVLADLCAAAIITHIDGLFYKQKSLFTCT